MKRLAEFIIKNYKKILTVSIIITLWALYESSKLEIKMSITDLLPKTEQVSLDYNYALDNYNSLDTIIVGVKGEREDIEAYISQLAEEVRGKEGVQSIRYRIEREYIEENLLLLAKLKDIKKQKGVFLADNLEEFIRGINENFEEVYVGDDTDKLEKDSKQLIYYLNNLEELLVNIEDGSSSKEDMKDLLLGDEFLMSPKGTMGIFSIKSNVSIDQMDRLIEFVDDLEKQLVDKGHEFGVEVVLTGPQVLARDEMVQTEKDTTLTTLLSLVLVLILFYKAFRYLRYSLISIIPLTMGIIVSLAITNILFGKLNMMTAMMGAILIGLGIDYAIHIITLYFEYCDLGYSKQDAIREVFNKGVKGIISGALTTSVGFLMFSISSFPGFSEFGIVLGLGIITVLLLSIFTLPSLLLVFSKGSARRKKEKVNNFDKLEAIVIKKNKTTLLITFALLSILCYKAYFIEFDKNMMNIQMKGLKSLALNDEIIEEFDMSSDSTITFTSTLDETDELKEELDKLKSIGEVETIATYLPSREKQLKSINTINRWKDELELEVAKEIDIYGLQEELYRLEANVIEISDLTYMSGDIKLSNRADDFIASGSIAKLADNIEDYEEGLKQSQSILISTLKELMTEQRVEELSIADLPLNLQEEFIGKDGRFLTTIYPKRDFWNADFQKIHVAELGTLDRNLTGTTLIYLKVVEAEITEGRRVLIFTFIGIYLILLIDMRSFKYSILTILPMFAAVASTFGLLSLLGLKLNLVNIIGIPLIVGIGVDDGVHIMHRYLIEKDIRPALHSTGKAVLMTTLTTIAAFGTMIFAKYRGFQTFGVLLIAGVAFAYFYTVIFMVALVALIDKDINK